MDMQDNPLGRGERKTPPDASPMRLEILDDKIDGVACQEKIKLLSMTGAPTLECTVLRSRGDFVMVEVLATASPAATDMRRNLRVPVEFDSLLYPVNGIFTVLNSFDLFFQLFGFTLNRLVGHMRPYNKFLSFPNRFYFKP